MKSLELKIPPLLLLGAAILLMVWLQGFYPMALLQHWLVYASGVLIIALGIGLMLFAAMQMRRHQATLDPRHPENSNILLDQGLFAISRNPIYLGMVVVLLGSALLFADITAFLVVMLFARYLVRYQIEPEEAFLMEKFPSEFSAYCYRVGRWL